MAMVMVGQFYESGVGTGRDLKVAKEWYKKSADLGCDSAIKALRRLS